MAYSNDQIATGMAVVAGHIRAAPFDMRARAFLYVPGLYRSLLVLLLFVLGIPLANAFSPDVNLRKDFWDTDGTVNSIAATNGKVYLGGAFTYVAPKGSKVISFDSLAGFQQRDFPKIYGAAIYAILQDNNGGWFIGGNFTSAGGQSVTNLVHILSDNTVDPNFLPNPNGAVHTLAQEGSRLYIGGDFTALAGQSRNAIAAWDISSHALLSWSPNANGTVLSLLISGNVVYTGGHFTQIGGQLRRNIAAVDVVSGVAIAWDPQADGDVLAIGLLDQKLYVGGFFNRIGGQLRNGLAALDVNSTNALAWNPNPLGGKITTLRAACNSVYVGGYFTNIAGVNRIRVAALDPETGIASPWNPNLDRFYSGNLPSYVLALEISGDTVYIAGQFATIAGQDQHDLAAVDATSGKLIPWSPGADGGVSAVATAGRRVLGGIITALGGQHRKNLAAFDEFSGAPLPFGSLPAPLDPDAPVNALALFGTNLFIGGDFTNVAGLPRNHLALIDTTSGLLRTNWTASANNSVFALATDGATLYAGGSFTLVNGLTRQRLVALQNATGQILSNWTAQADASIYTLDLNPQGLFAGGSFIAISGSTRHRLAQLNPANGAVQPWAPDVNAPVYAVHLANNTVYAGGAFTQINGAPRNFVAAIDPLTASLTTWNPGADDEVRAILLSETNIFLGGIFQHVAGQERFGCAAVAADGSLQSWNPGSGPGNRVYAFALSDKLLYVGGDLPLEFSTDSSLFSFAAFPQVGAPIIVQYPLDQAKKLGKNVSFSVLAAGNSPLTYEWTLNGGNLPPGVSNSTSTNISFIIPTTNFAQYGGTYTVTVSNDLGVARAEAVLIVRDAPAIQAQPISQSVGPGSTVALSVSASGSPPPIYQWRLNGVNIPGAISPTLTLTNISATQGGDYYVAVGNQEDTINSAVAQVVVLTPALSFADSFAARGLIAGSSGVGTGNNSLASIEPNEPKHAQKLGGKSVWVSWIAPATGIATFSTRGSSFDTLLAVYSGNDFTNLQLVASDEDRGGFLTSQVDFNADAGTEYAIAVDGLSGANGPLTLSWQLDTTASAFPRITQQPLSQSVAPGGSALFQVAAASPMPLAYQWFFGCRQIKGATNSTFLITNIQTRDVGYYHVLVVNGSSHFAQSLPAALELSSFPGVISYDKLEDAVSSAGGNFVGGSALLVSLGSIVSQTIDTSTNTAFINESNHCGSMGGASAWIRFQPTADGHVLVDTIGSLFDTVLAVYQDTNLVILAQNPAAALIDCDDNGAPDGIRSQLKFKTKAGVKYLAVVDGAQRSKGVATVHWQLGTKPVIVNSALNVSMHLGNSAVLSSGTTSTTAITYYQWYCNGFLLVGATNSTLTLTNLHPIQSGSYTVVVSNFVDVVTNYAAEVSLDVPFQLDPASHYVNGQFQSAVWGQPNQRFILLVSSNLTTWMPLLTNQITKNSFPFTETNPGPLKTRFYRALLQQ